MDITATTAFETVDIFDIIGRMVPVTRGTAKRCIGAKSSTMGPCGWALVIEEANGTSAYFPTDAWRITVVAD